MGLDVSVINMRTYQEHEVVKIMRKCAAIDLTTDKTLNVPAGTEGTIISVLNEDWYTVEFDGGAHPLPIIMNIHRSTFAE